MATAHSKHRGQYTVLSGSQGVHPPWWRGTSMATDTSTSPSQAKLAGSASYSGDVSVLLGNGDGTFQAQAEDAAGEEPDLVVAGDFTGDGRLDLAVLSRAPTMSRCCWATATARSNPGHLRGGLVPILDRGGRLQWRRPARPGRRGLRTARVRCCWATATAHSSLQITVAASIDTGLG